MILDKTTDRALRSARSQYLTIYFQKFNYQTYSDALLRLEIKVGASYLGCHGKLILRTLSYWGVGKSWCLGDELRDGKSAV